ncbi:AmmeMemoRadiSam system protein B [Hydrogenobacter sp. T-2]|uniref:AmmeMemoRadiSam system protein B n=1 Tax=Pampinifervens diazotrophicum TaxID=1632018 RepID=UPI002B26446D|nr:AmmeMemoRadiSam system protein B [Hydrogenobacter sp. T-2]WPM33006.1 AmmeMemoRadiSam system protein B [Hydrogenobacter sp. T-2]
MKPKVRSLEVVPYGESFWLKDPMVISEGLMVSYHGLVLLSFMDGTRELEELRAEFFKRTGIILKEQELREFIELLERYLLLEGENFQRTLNSLRQEMLRKGVRPMSHAGEVYPEDAESCRAFLMGEEKEKRDLLGLVVPHMDLRVARKTYWEGYGRLKADKRLVVILGVSHYWHEMPFSVLPLHMETPLGILETRKDLLEKLQSFYNFDITHDLFSYKQEHSIEFASIYAKMLFPESKALALIVSYGDRDFLKTLAENLLRVIDRELHHTLIISSVDLSHVGKKFGDERSYDPSFIDRKYLELLQNLRGDDAFELLQEGSNFTRIDGQYTNLVFSHMLKEAGIQKGELFDYSFYYENLTDSIVSYASMGF